VTVEFEKRRGFLARIGEAIGIGRTTPINVRWSQPGPGGRFPVSFTLDLRDADSGDHTLRVSIARPGLSPVTVERSVRVEG
jgi:hypothetical protein